MRNIKKIALLFLIFFILNSSNLFPKIITRGDVETALSNWIELENKLDHLRLNEDSIQLSTIRELFYRNTLIGFIVDLEPTGFILVPSVSELSPVKFISFSGVYDEIEKHPFIQELKDRLYFTVKNLGYAGEQDHKRSDLGAVGMDTRQKEKNEGVWEKLLSEDFRPELYLSASSLNSVSPMLRSKWGYKYPYNACCPEIDGFRCSPGCGSISQAQVMYYWEYPEEGQGVYSYFWGNGNKYLSADFQHEYYWDRMFNKYTGIENQERIGAVARLIADVGIAKRMSYGLGGSFSGPDRNNSLVSFFKYASDKRQVLRSDYSSWTDWFNVFREQMDCGWPALLSICKKGVGCHSVVVDGYRTETDVNQVHVNMGWGGLADNYYTIDDIYGYGAVDGDVAVINIHPPDCTNTGNVKGKVTGEKGNALKDVQIKFYDPDEKHVKSAWTDDAGNFVAECLKEGTYKIFFDVDQTGNYLSEWYRDKDSFDVADTVSVTTGHSTPGIDAVITEAGGIEGKVSDNSGKGIPDVGAIAYSATGSYVSWTDLNGNYGIQYLKKGDYKLCFYAPYAPGLYATEWYDNKKSLEKADPISVKKGKMNSGIDAILEKGGNIAGQVKNSAGGGIDDNVWIYVYTPSGGYVLDWWIDIYGDYEVIGLMSGNYKIYFDASDTEGNYVSEWYDDKDTLKSADLVSVTEGSTTAGIDCVLICEAPIHAPLNLRGRKEENRSLTQTEYINVLTWQNNPDNENIVKYRIYLAEGETRSLLGELDTETFDKTYEYWHRRVEKDKSYTYVLVALNVDGREGDPAYVTVQ